MTDSTDDARALVDTNVLVYAHEPDDLVRHQPALELLSELSDSGRLVFSIQVLNEFCSVMMHPRRPTPLSAVEVSEIVADLAATGAVVPLTPSMTLLALDAVARHGLSFWDGLIWAAARENDITLVYTEDFQRDRLIDGVRFLTPFLPCT